MPELIDGIGKAALPFGAGLGFIPGVGGGAKQFLGAITGANAAQSTAQAQLDAQIGLQNRASELVAPTAAELSLQGQQIAAQQANLQRQQQLLAAVDPAFMEAGRQALALLQGKSAPTLQPYNQLAEQQRNQLIQSLQSQMGPGALTSTSGQSALRQFDLAHGAQSAQLQQSYLNTLLGASAQGEAAGNPLPTIQSMQGTQQLMQSQQSMQANALIGTSTTPYAGAPYAGSAVLGSILPGLAKAAAEGAGKAAASGAAG